MFLHKCNDHITGICDPVKYDDKGKCILAKCSYCHVEFKPQLDTPTFEGKFRDSFDEHLK